MKELIQLLKKSLLIALALGGIGLVANHASDDPVAWVYIPPGEIVISNVKLLLIDEKEAVRYLKDHDAVFVDCRECKDYLKSHVKGALCLAPDDFERRFPVVEPLIPIQSRIILYCYGPSCDMAERVGVCLGQMGYPNLMIMTSGFPVWDNAKYPVEGSTEKGTVSDDFFDGIIDEKASYVEIASARPGLQSGLHRRMGGYYVSSPPTLTLQIHGRLIALHTREIFINALKDEVEAEKIVDSLKKEINQTWVNRDRMEPTYDKPPVLQMLEI